MAQFLMEDSSWDVLTSKVLDTCRRLEELGLPIPHTVYVDNTVASENSIRAAVLGVVHVKEDHFHAMRRVTDELPDELAEKREWQRLGRQGAGCVSVVCVQGTDLYHVRHADTLSEQTPAV